MGYAPLFVVGQTDTLPAYTVSLTDTSNKPVNLSTATGVTFTMSSGFTGLVVDAAASIINAPTGTVQYAWNELDTLTPGIYVVSWTVAWTGGTTTTYPQTGYDFVTVMTDLAMGYPDVTPTFNTIWTGTAAPLSANGNNGDFWYNTTTAYFYGPKNNGTWPAGFLLNSSLIPLNNLAAPTGNLSMSGFQINNLASGTAATDAAAFGQIPKMGIDVTQAPYGADPTGLSDSTAAFTAAFSALSSAGGGTLFCPTGKYIFTGTSPLTLTNISNIKIQGVGGLNPSGSANAGTIFYYQGTGSADFIKLQGCTGIQIRDISFNGSSSSWTGNYINTTYVSGTTNSINIENCYFDGLNTTSASAVNLMNSATVTVKNCLFSGCVYHINGGGSGNSSQSSNVTVDTCYFLAPGTDSIFNPGSVWVVKGCNFASNGIVSSGQPTSNLTVLGNTFAGAAGTTYGVSTYGTGISVVNNLISGLTVGVNIQSYSNSLTVKSNQISGCVTGIATVDTVGTDISNNYFSACTTGTSYNATSTNLIANGNFDKNGSGSSPTGWGPNGSAPAPTRVTGDGVLGGQQCYKVITPSTQGGLQSSTMSWTANQTYQVSCWIKQVSGSGNPALYYYDAAQPSGGYSTNSAVVTTTGVWTYVSFTITSAHTTNTPTPYVYVWNSVSGASTFEVAGFVARQGTTLLPTEFSLNYVGNTYSSVATNITGSYTQCGVVEEPAGEIIRYGTPLNTSGINQTSGYDAILGNNLYVPGNTSLTGTLGVTGSTTLLSTLGVTGATTLTGGITGGLSINGLTGAVAASRYVGATTGGAPTSGTFAVGDYTVDNVNAAVWICVSAGSPGSWVSVSQGTRLMATPISTSSSGTVTPGTAVETFDAVLGYYQCSLVSGKRYRAVLDGLIGNSGTAAADFTIQIRNSGTASNPTSASTLIAQTEWLEGSVVGTSGRQGIVLRNTFIAPATGTNTFGVSATSNGTTPVFTPLGNRELYVEIV